MRTKKEVLKNMLTGREKLVLKALVSEYIKTGKPQGSKYLSEEIPYLKKYAPATIRADMCNLENLNFLEKTHTSSGRIPSTKALRYYVENLLTPSKECEDLFPVVDKIANKAIFSKSGVVEALTSLLSSIKKSCIVSYESYTISQRVKSIQLIALSEQQAVLLIVLENGRVSHYKIDIPKYFKLSVLTDWLAALTNTLENKELTEVIDTLSFQLQPVLADDPKTKFIRFLIKVLRKEIVNLHSDKYTLLGFENFQDNQFFQTSAEMHSFKLLLSVNNLKNLINEDTGLAIRFTKEIDFINKYPAVLFTLPYRTGNSVSCLALLAPDNVDYNTIIPLLKYIEIKLLELFKKEVTDE